MRCYVFAVGQMKGRIGLFGEELGKTPFFINRELSWWLCLSLPSQEESPHSNSRFLLAGGCRGQRSVDLWSSL